MLHEYRVLQRNRIHKYIVIQIQILVHIPIPRKEISYKALAHTIMEAEKSASWRPRKVVIQFKPESKSEDRRRSMSQLEDSQTEQVLPYSGFCSIQTFDGLDETTLGRIICFTQSTNCSVNLAEDHRLPKRQETPQVPG